MKRSTSNPTECSTRFSLRSRKGAGERDPAPVLLRPAPPPGLDPGVTSPRRTAGRGGLGIRSRPTRYVLAAACGREWPQRTSNSRMAR
jgi:hypothetical protein